LPSDVTGERVQDSVHSVEVVFLLLLFFVVAFGMLAGRLRVPYPMVLVIGGLLLSFVRGIPKISLDPNFVFLVVLPPYALQRSMAYFLA
jgi:CPA1 family monovalent cation:H+ antiporter